MTPLLKRAVVAAAGAVSKGSKPKAAGKSGVVAKKAATKKAVTAKSPAAKKAVSKKTAVVKTAATKVEAPAVSNAPAEVSA